MMAHEGHTPNINDASLLPNPLIVVVQQLGFQKRVGGNIWWHMSQGQAGKSTQFLTHRAVTKNASRRDKFSPELCPCNTSAAAVKFNAVGKKNQWPAIFCWHPQPCCINDGGTADSGSAPSYALTTMPHQPVLPSLFCSHTCFSQSTLNHLHVAAAAAPAATATQRPS